MDGQWNYRRRCGWRESYRLKGVGGMSGGHEAVVRWKRRAGRDVGRGVESSHLLKVLGGDECQVLGWRRHVKSSV